MPSSVMGLALFVVLLGPGLTYVIFRELRSPTRVASSFRETAAVAFASILFNGIALLVFAVIRAKWPDATPDVGELIRNRHLFIKHHYRTGIAWSMTLLVIACALAGVSGRFASRWGRRFTGGISFYSAWWELMSGEDRPPGHTVFIGCELDDGSYVSGELLTLSTEVEENADRDLVLRPPIRYRPAGEADDVALEVSGLVVSARRLKFMSYTYIPEVVGEAS